MTPYQAYCLYTPILRGRYGTQDQCNRLSLVVLGDNVSLHNRSTSWMDAGLLRGDRNLVGPSTVFRSAREKPDRVPKPNSSCVFWLWPDVRIIIFALLLLGTVLVTFFERCSIALVLQHMPWNQDREVRLS